MVKVKGGPITKEGKAISSQNAVKHGALSKKFQSSEEQKAYNQLLCSLQAEFQQPNPLVQMQLERIASLKIQLDRIQHHIDLTYAISQSESEKIEKVCEHLNISTSDLYPSSYRQHEDKGLAIFLKALEPAIHELLANPWNYFETAQEFLDQMPNFCAFLAFSADKKDEKINMLVNRLIFSFESIAMELSIQQSVSSYISSGKASDIRVIDLIDPLVVSAMIPDRHGAKLHAINEVAFDWAMPVATQMVTDATHWVQALADVAAAVAQLTGATAPVAGNANNPQAQAIAKSLHSGERKAVLLGNAAAHHAKASSLLALANWIGAQTGATVGYLGEAANTVGAQVVGAVPSHGGQNAAQMGRGGLKAALLLHTEPHADMAHGAAAVQALEKAV